MQWSCHPSFTLLGGSFHFLHADINQSSYDIGAATVTKLNTEYAFFQWSVRDFFHTSRPTSQNAFHLHRLIKFYEFLMEIEWHWSAQIFSVRVLPLFFRETQVTITVLEFRWATSWELWSVSLLLRKTVVILWRHPGWGPMMTWRMGCFCFMEPLKCIEMQSDAKCFHSNSDMLLNCLWYSTLAPSWQDLPWFAYFLQSQAERPAAVILSECRYKKWIKREPLASCSLRMQLWQLRVRPFEPAS